MSDAPLRASDNIANTAGTASETNVLKGTADVLMLPELANEATTWYLADNSRPIKGLIWQLRRAVTMTQMTQPNDAGVFFQKEFVWGIDGRGEVSYGPWWLLQRNIA